MGCFLDPLFCEKAVYAEMVEAGQVASLSLIFFGYSAPSAY